MIYPGRCPKLRRLPHVVALCLGADLYLFEILHVCPLRTITDTAPSTILGLGADLDQEFVMTDLQRLWSITIGGLFPLTPDRLGLACGTVIAAVPKVFRAPRAAVPFHSVSIMVPLDAN